MLFNTSVKSFLPKALITLAFTIIFLYLSLDAWSKHSQRLTTTVIRYRNKSISRPILPDISLCPLPAFKTGGSFFTKEDFRLQTFGLNDILDQESLETLTFNKSSPEHWIRVESTWYGACFTFKRSSSPNASTIYFGLKKNFDVMVYLHFPGDEIWLVGGSFPTDYAVITVEANNQKNLSSLDVIYSGGKYSMMNKPETPCTEFGDDFSTGHQLFLECSRKSLAANIRKLPCIPGGVDPEIFQEKIDLKFCDNAETAENAMCQIKNGKLLHLTQCKLPCQRTRFSYKTAYGHSNSMRRFSNDSNEKLTVYIYELSDVSEEKIETFVYDFLGLVAAIGGNMGLFLGFSCLSIALFLAKKIETCGLKVGENCFNLKIPNKNGEVTDFKIDM